MVNKIAIAKIFKKVYINIMTIVNINIMATINKTTSNAKKHMPL